MNNNIKQYEQELKERQQRRINEDRASFNDDYIPKTLPQTIKRRFKQQTLILDNTNSIIQSENPNEFIVELMDSLKNVVALRLLKTEYTMPSSVAYLLVSGKKIAYSIFNTVAVYIYLNGYSNILLCNNKNNELFAQMSVGADMMPALSGNFFYDPYSYIFNPIQKKLKRFHVKICDNAGNILPNTGDIRVILTIAAFTVEYI